MDQDPARTFGNVRNTKRQEVGLLVQTTSLSRRRSCRDARRTKSNFDLLDEYITYEDFESTPIQRKHRMGIGR